MSHAIKAVASIALPVLGAVAGSFVGMPELGGALGGAISGGVVNHGGVLGAITGGIGGYLGADGINNLVNGVVGASAGAPLVDGFGNQIVSGNAGALLSGSAAPTAATFGGSGISGALTGGGLQALGTATPQGMGILATGGAGAGSIASSLGGNDSIKALLGIGNQVASGASAQTATDAAKTINKGVNNAIATQQPYSQFGQDAMNQIQTIQADPGAYVANNPFYGSLADEAQRRLSASSASKGKLASGGTQAALQDNLLQLGTGLVNQQVNTLQNQVATGQGAANNTSNLQTSGAAATAAGQVGANNALTSGYQNQINTLLALQNLQKAPSYAPTSTVSL